MSAPEHFFERLERNLADPRTLRHRIQDSRPVQGGRRAATLVLISDTADPDIVFIERATTLRKHAGQIAFPGGGQDPGDATPADTALRETHEEIGLPPSAVTVRGVLPAAHVAASGFDVTSVVGTWDGQEHVGPLSRDEVAAVHRFSVADLADPARRWTARHPSGYLGPAWQFGDVFIWGFTAHIVDGLLELAGWDRPWDADRVTAIPERFMRDRIGRRHD